MEEREKLTMAYYQSYQTYYPQYQQQYIPQPQQTIPAQVQNPPIQNGGFISVRNEAEARNYPIAPGNSITFKDENAPYVYVKTMGFSQLDRPNFEKFRLVKEQEPSQIDDTTVFNSEMVSSSMYAEKGELEQIKADSNQIREEITAINNRIAKLESVKAENTDTEKKKGAKS